MTEKVSGDGSTIVNPSTMPEEGSVVSRPYTVSRDESGKKNPSLPSIKNVDPSTMQADGLATTHLPPYPPTLTYPPTPLPTYPPSLGSDENTMKTCPHILQCKGNHVVAAPKINMEIGQLVYKSHSLKDPFIRLVDNKMICKVAYYLI